jgi:hypothetical protein
MNAVSIPAVTRCDDETGRKDDPTVLIARSGSETRGKFKQSLAIITLWTDSCEHAELS